MRHFIVPYCYRTLLLPHFKMHLSHDVVILCPSCHFAADQRLQRRKTELERYERRRVHEQSAQAELVDPAIQRVQRAANALLKWNETLPESKVSQYEELVRQWWLEESGDEPCDHDGISRVQLERACQLQSRIRNPLCVSSTRVVISSLQKDGAFDEDACARFVRDWRRHFVDSMMPRFLPTGWSIDASAQSDKR